MDEISKKTLPEPLNFTEIETKEYVYNSIIPDDFHNVLFEILVQNGIDADPFNVLFGPNFRYFLEHKGPHAFKRLLHQRLFIKKGPKSAYIQLCGPVCGNVAPKTDKSQHNKHIRLWSVNTMSKVS